MKVSNWEIWMLTLDLLGEMTSCAVPTVAHSGWGSSVFLFYGVGDIYIFWFCFVLGPPWWCPLLNPGIALRSHSWWGAGDWTWAGRMQGKRFTFCIISLSPVWEIWKIFKNVFSLSHCRLQSYWDCISGIHQSLHQRPVPSVTVPSFSPVQCRKLMVFISFSEPFTRTRHCSLVIAPHLLNRRHRAVLAHGGRAEITDEWGEVYKSHIFILEV